MKKAAPRRSRSAKVAMKASATTFAARECQGFEEYVRPYREVEKAAFNRAVDAVAAEARTLIASLTTTAEPKNREVEAAKARARSAERFAR